MVNDATGGTRAGVKNEASTVNENGVARAYAGNSNEARHEGTFGKSGTYNTNEASAGVKNKDGTLGASANAVTKGRAGVRSHDTYGIDAGAEIGYNVGVGADAEVGKMTGAGVSIGAGLEAEADTKFGDGGKVGVGFGNGRGFGAGGKAGVDEKGSVVAEAEAGGFGGGFSAGGDHAVGVKVKAFGLGVEVKIPKFW